MTVKDQPVAAPVRSLINPVADFFCLGGLTLFLLPFLKTLPPPEQLSAGLGFLIISYLLNATHFTSTYQMFYRDFRRKAFDPALSPGFRARYLFAAIVFPAALIGFAVYGALQPDTQTIGMMANLMLFLVGWHYAKQGYGVLIIDSVYKRRFLDAGEKRVFRTNTIACWLAFWSLNNKMLPHQEYWNIVFHSLPVPEILVGVFLVAGIGTTLAVLFVIARRILLKRPLPFIGTTAYLITLYVWSFAFTDPILLLAVPVFHALQYHAVVWRYQLNRETEAESRQPLWLRLCLFACFAILLGYLGFWGVPHILDGTIAYDHMVFGATLFIFIFRIFINVHHYVMDSVIWRGDNPDTGTYLFNAPRAH